MQTNLEERERIYLSVKKWTIVGIINIYEVEILP